VFGIVADSGLMPVHWFKKWCHQWQNSDHEYYL